MLENFTAELTALIAAASGAAGWLIGDLRGAERLRRLYEECNGSEGAWMRDRSRPVSTDRQVDKRCALSKQDVVLARQRRFRREDFAAMPPLAELRAEAAEMRHIARQSARTQDATNIYPLGSSNERQARAKLAASTQILEDYEDAIRTLHGVNHAIADLDVSSEELLATEPAREVAELPTFSDAAPIQVSACPQDLALARHRRAQADSQAAPSYALRRSAG